MWNVSRTPLSYRDILGLDRDNGKPWRLTLNPTTSQAASPSERRFDISLDEWETSRVTATVLGVISFGTFS